MQAPVTTESTQTPDLAQVLRLVLRQHAESLWHAMPGYVDTYDAATQRADVRIAVHPYRSALEGETREELPVLPGVPVAHTSGGGFVVHAPLKAGDPVVVVFMSRELEAWKSSQAGQAVNALDNRLNHLSDAMCFPGGRPPLSAVAGLDPDKLTVGRPDGGHLTVSTDGTMALKPGGSAKVELAGAAFHVADGDKLQTFKTELIAFLNTNLMPWLQDHTHSHPNGATGEPQQNPPPTFATTVLGSVAGEKVTAS